VWSFHGDDSGKHLACDIVQTGRWILTLQGNVQGTSSGAAHTDGGLSGTSLPIHKLQGITVYRYQ